MGAGPSSVILRNIEEGNHALQTRGDIDKQLRFFRAWSLEDVDRALRRSAAFAHLFDGFGGAALDGGGVRALLEAPLSWADYYAIVTDTDRERRRAAEVRRRATWHVTAAGYAMQVDERAEAELEAFYVGGTVRPAEEDWEDAAHTDDETDSDSDDGAESQLAAAPAAAKTPTTTTAAVAEAEAPGGRPAAAQGLPAKWDPALASPVFFGYLRTAASAVAARDAAAERVVEEREVKSAAARREKRTRGIDDFRRALETRAAARARKVVALREAHAAAKKARDREQRSALDSFELDDEKEDYAAESAAEEAAVAVATAGEVARLEAHGAARERAERQELLDRETEARCVDAAESDAAPGGLRLERAARAALQVLQRALDDACEALEEAQDQLDLQRAADEEEDDDGDAPDADQAGHFVAAMRARLHECEGAVKRCLADLDDGEATLESAVLRRTREDLVLPLFAPLAAQDDALQVPAGLPLGADGDTSRTTARLVDVAAALVVACGAPLAAKARLLLRLFDFDCDGFIEDGDLVVALQCTGRLLAGLGFLRRPPADADVASAVRRAMVEAAVRQDALASAPLYGMTLAEAQGWLAQTVAQSTYLSSLFGADFAFGELSAYQRRRMPAVRMLELGLAGPADVKYRFAVETAKCRPELASDAKAAVHEKALARGADDALKSDYSRFLPQPKARGSSHAVPLVHGHLANLRVLVRAEETRMAAKLQNIWRGLKARQRAEAAARLQAFGAARGIAVKEARQRIQDEFDGKEALQGMARRKWDAKVRMVQAKKRATGLSLDRDATVRLLAQEQADATAADVNARFDEIEAARGLRAGAERPPDATHRPPPRAVDALRDTLDAVAEGAPHEIATPRTLADGAAGAAVGAPEDDVPPPNAGAALVVAAAGPTLSERRVQCMAVGAFPQALYATGEAAHERVLRAAYAAPDASGAGLQLRLRALGGAVTALKAEELMLELPSKPLLLRYVEVTLALDDAAPRHAPTALFDGLSEAPVVVALRRWRKQPRLTAAVGPAAAFPGLGLPDLAQALDAVRPAALEGELSGHFRLVHGAEGVARGLRQLLCSDFDRGSISAVVVDRHARHDAWCARRARAAADAAADAVRAQLECKARAALASSQATKAPADAKTLKGAVRGQAEAALEKIDAELEKQAALASEAQAALAKQEKKLRSIRLSSDELGRRRDALVRCMKRADGADPPVRVAPAERRDWSERYLDAMRGAPAADVALSARNLPASEPSLAAVLVPAHAPSAVELARLREVVHVSEEFLMVCQRGAVTIVQEMHLPAGDKSIRPVSSKPCDGRAAAGGRRAETQRYEFCNVRFEIATDDHGIFSGSDAYAAKAAGHARNGAREYLRHVADIPGLVVPLTATVDYHGFRVLCVAKLALAQVTFGDGGEVRREREELVHGTADRGATVVNSNRALDGMLAAVAAKLNLAKHAVRGARDLNAKELHASVDLRGFRLADAGGAARFGLVNFWRALPSERACAHLAEDARGHAMFWRMLRPEFLRDLPLPLSPDADGAITRGVADEQVLADRSEEATRLLVTRRVADVAEALADRGPRAFGDVGPAVAYEPERTPLYEAESAEPASAARLGDAPFGAARGFGLDVTAELHRRGVNLRHLGLMRARFWKRLSASASADFGSSVLRTNADFRLEIERGATLRVQGRLFRVSTDPRDVFDGGNCPLDGQFDGLSCGGVAVDAGEVRDARNSAAVRLALLCEMVARACKGLVRLQLRRSAELSGAVVEAIAPTFVVDTLNALTGAAPRADATWREQLVPALRQRYGARALDDVEAGLARVALRQCAPFLVRRVAQLLGVLLAPRALAALDAAPDGFEFHRGDVCGASPFSLAGALGDAAAASAAATSARFAALAPVVKHGLPFLDGARAMLLAARAAELRADVYAAVVLRHAPPFYMPLDERAGARIARNRGALAALMDGAFPRGALPGAVFAFTDGAAAGVAGRDEARAGADAGAARCAQFLGRDADGGDAGLPSSIVCAYHGRCAVVDSAKAFAIEAWCSVARGHSGATRVAVASGRAALSVLVDDRWCFVAFDGEAEAVIIGPAAAFDRWTHVCGTYDGTLLRFFVDSKLAGEVEFAKVIGTTVAASEAARRDALKQIDAAERTSRGACKAATEKEALAVLRTKAGLERLKKASIKLVEQAQFKLKMDARAAENGAVALTKEAALAEATAALKQELYLRNVQQLATLYRRLRDDVAEKARKDAGAGVERSRRPVVVGATTPSGRAREGRNFWRGRLAHVALYDSLVTADDVARHHRGGQRGGDGALDNSTARERDAARLYGLAAEHFAVAIVKQPDDAALREHYALALVAQLALDDSDARAHAPARTAASLGPARRRSHALLCRAVAALEAHKCADTLAELLRLLPDGTLHAHRAVDVLEALLRVDGAYFATDRDPPAAFGLAELARLPMRFGLSARRADRRLFACAAHVHRLVLGDLLLAETFGGVDLSWAAALASDRALNSLVDAAERGDDARLVALGRFSHDDDVDDDVRDGDLKLVANFRRLAVAFDLTGCAGLTDASTAYAAKACTVLQSVTLDGCDGVGDATLLALAGAATQLALVSVQGCGRVTDAGLAPLLRASRARLRALNVSFCGGVTDAALAAVARHCDHIELLHAAFCTQLSDRGVYDFCVGHAASTHLRSLDLSFCPGLTDDGVAAVGERCVKLQYLNLAGVSKITDAAARVVTHNLWKLETLNLDDLALITDAIFHFDAVRDGRNVAQTHMLTSLTDLRLGECTRLTDRGLGGISTRCPSLRRLQCVGVSGLTDAGAAVLVAEPTRGLPRGADLRAIDLSRCVLLTDASIDAIARGCGQLDEFKASGCTLLTDAAVKALAAHCPLIRTLCVNRCRRLTDASACHVADKLWVEHLEVAHLPKLTDAGLEVLALEQQGLTRLDISGCHSLTDRALDVLRYQALGLVTLAVVNSPNFTPHALDGLATANHALRILRSPDDVLREDSPPWSTLK